MEILILLAIVWFFFSLGGGGKRQPSSYTSSGSSSSYKPTKVCAYCRGGGYVNGGVCPACFGTPVS